MDNSLRINFDKTKYMLFHKANDIVNVNVNPQIICAGHEIERVYTFKYLGVILDPNLNFNSHFLYVKKRVSSSIGVLTHLKRFLPFSVFCILLKAYVLTIIDYCLPIWGVRQNSDLQSLQCKINNVILNFSEPPSWLKKCKKVKSNPTTECCILEKANILSVSERFKYYTTKITFKTLKLKLLLENIDDGIKIPYIKYNMTMFSMRKKSVTRAGSTRLIDKNYKWKSSTYEKSFKFRATELWNSLPKSLHDENISLKKFNSTLYKHYLDQRNSVYITYKPL